MTMGTSAPLMVAAVDAERLCRSVGGARIVDVRTPAEFESVHIPGSYHVPLDQIAQHCAALREVGVPLVLVCQSGQRACQAEILLRDAGVQDLSVLDGGIGGWQSAGLAVEQGRKRWSLERQVRAIAGGLVLVGTIGSLLLWQPLIYLAMFVGGGLLFAGLTDTCMMGLLLLRLPYNRGSASDTVSVVNRLRADATGARAAA
jgi:rhodanese-related sulfurtransferase